MEARLRYACVSSAAPVLCSCLEARLVATKLATQLCLQDAQLAMGVHAVLLVALLPCKPAVLQKVEIASWLTTVAADCVAALACRTPSLQHS
jgi:hypothetical protein